MTREPDLRGLRWDALLPLAAAIVALLLTGLASLAGYAFKQREAYALDGRVLGLAHRIESNLRETGQNSDDDLEEILRQEIQGPVLGLRLLEGGGRVVATAGTIDHTLSLRHIDLFIGPSSGTRGRSISGQQHGRRGRRTLDVFLNPGAASPPLPIRLLLPASIGVGLGLVALAVLGGRLLIRQRRDAQLEADQRRMEALGRAGAGLAHQLRNPLATIKGSAQLLGERLTDEEPRHRAHTIVAQADRMDRMLGTLLDFARPPQPEPTTIDLSLHFDALASELPKLRIEVPPSLKARVDADHLDHMIENLISNARSHAPEDSAIEIAAHPAGNSVEVHISDRGPGPGDNPEDLFQPYVSHRPDGAGLGLTIARTLAEANGGSLTLRTRKGGGTTAILAIPLGDRD